MAGLAGSAQAATRSPATLRPAVTLTGTTCTRTGTGTWAVTARWAANGGRYTDLGSPGAWTRTAVNGGRRTWQARVSVSGWGGIPGPVPAPTSVVLGWGELVAPAGWRGDVTREQYWQGAARSIRVTCR